MPYKSIFTIFTTDYSHNKLFFELLIAKPTVFSVGLCIFDSMKNNSYKNWLYNFHKGNLLLALFIVIVVLILWALGFINL